MLGGMTSWYHISSLMAPLVGWHLRWVDIPGEMAHWYGTPGWDGIMVWHPGWDVIMVWHLEVDGTLSGLASRVGWHPRLDGIPGGLAS